MKIIRLVLKVCFRLSADICININTGKEMLKANREVTETKFSFMKLNCFDIIPTDNKIKVGLTALNENKRLSIKHLSFLA